MTNDVLAIQEPPLVLKRPGGRGLQAWDAADELLIEAAQERLQVGQRVAIVDDGFGALTLALNHLHPSVIADNAGLKSVLADNARANGMDVDVPQDWAVPSLGPFDAVVMRIPRQIDYLEYILRWANEVLDAGGLIIAGGMIKHIPDHGVGVFNRLVETDQVLPARKKARVVVCRAGEAGLAGWDRQWQGYRLPDSGLEVRSLPAVFARDHLDIGARLLMPQVSKAVAALPPGGRILDLACGNGVQGMVALAERPDLTVSFSDVSSQAVVSARANVQGAFPDADTEFLHADGIPVDLGEFDLILLNPPFHEGGVVGDHIALRLFRQASRHLSRDGRLLVVGNRHLGYHKSLRRDFTRVSQLASDPKFVVFEAGR